MARSVVVLADASKFQRVEPGFVCGLEEVDVIVTDAPPAPATAAALREKGIRLIVARPEAPSTASADQEGVLAR
jgi:DeoR/GlpR family transcriptional regulator of sugar metabolism